ncbi:MAG TPA: 50S ribosomal protein L24 [Nitrospinota bacterium]|nr:50S ribosomal protein L24 [Nitrospinota bacterium]
MKVKKNDIVMVVSGTEKGKRGKVIEARPNELRVIVEKVNVVKRHQRPTQQQRQGGIIEREAPVHVSNVQLFCSSCNKAVRIGTKRLEDGKKVRICRSCGEMLDTA